MNITFIEYIQAEARAAYEAGNDKCPWPFDAPEHDVWVDAFVAVATADELSA